MYITRFLDKAWTSFFPFLYKLLITKKWWCRSAPWPLRVQCQQQTPPTPTQRFPFSRQMSVIRSRMSDKKAHHPKWHYQVHGHKAVMVRSWNLSFQTSAAWKSDPGWLVQTPRVRGRHHLLDLIIEDKYFFALGVRAGLRVIWGRPCTVK